MRLLACLAAAALALLMGCANALPAADVLLLGEQHDAATHQQRHRDAVQTLARQSRLAALALEMAEQGGTTAGLPRDSDESAVQAALRWNEQAWPWAAYGPAVMAAVRAGVPVLGANLPRERMRESMADTRLDALLPVAALEAQRKAIRDGHCGLLPDTQIAPMTRIQIARDRAMAGVLAQAAVPGKTVVLLAGSGHVDESLGVPVHLPAGVSVRSLRWPTSEAPQKDYCAEMRRQMAPRP
ncbi:MAG TPA: ChaN family lipoprotein [Ramlibacter sp.]|nr:ChaN family lipoprotein [Ramlibacter sp.]